MNRTKKNFRLPYREDKEINKRTLDCIDHPNPLLLIVGITVFVSGEELGHPVSIDTNHPMLVILVSIASGADSMHRDITPIPRTLQRRLTHE